MKSFRTQLRGSAVVALLLALISVLAVQPALRWGKVSYNASTAVTGASHVYDGHDNSAQQTHGYGADTGRGGPSISRPEVAESAKPFSLSLTFVAAETEAGAAARALSYSSKIEGQMGPRGWSQESIEAAVKNPSETHSVWDFTTGDKQPATAYVQRGGGYVVVNDETNELVQVSNLNKSGWKPVWEDPRFMR